MFGSFSETAKDLLSLGSDEVDPALKGTKVIKPPVAF
jgi:hypothetical protein